MFLMLFSCELMALDVVVFLDFVSCFSWFFNAVPSDFGAATLIIAHAKTEVMKCAAVAIGRIASHGGHPQLRLQQADVHIQLLDTLANPALPKEIHDVVSH